MPKFDVSLDLIVPVLIEVEADDEDAAIDKACAMSRTELLKHASTEEEALDIISEGVTASPGRD